MIINEENVEKIRPYMARFTYDLDSLILSNKAEDKLILLDILDDLFAIYIQADGEPSDLSLMFEKIRDQFYYDNFIR